MERAVVAPLYCGQVQQIAVAVEVRVVFEEPVHADVVDDQFPAELSAVGLIRPQHEVEPRGITYPR